jgi:hypothetical protein
MVRRYAHFSAEHLAPFADRLVTLGVAAENVGHVLVTPNEKEVSASELTP